MARIGAPTSASFVAELDPSQEPGAKEVEAQFRHRPPPPPPRDHPDQFTHGGPPQLGGQPLQGKNTIDYNARLF